MIPRENEALPRYQARLFIHITMMSMSVVLLLKLLVVGCLCQRSEVTQCIPEYQWSINTRMQTPCLVAAYLETSCGGAPITIPTIPAGNHYEGPPFPRTNPCICNTVTYSAISACGGCQNRTFISYSQWTQNCPYVIETGRFPMPIAPDISLPSWTTLNISLTNDTFDPHAASVEAARAGALPTTNTPTSTSIDTSQETTTSGSTGPQSSSVIGIQETGGVSSGVIAGSVVAALVAIVIITLIIFWVLLRARRKRNAMASPLDMTVGDKPSISVAAHFPGNYGHARSYSDPPSVITPFTMNSGSEISRQPISPMTSLYTTAHQNSDYGRSPSMLLAHPHDTSNPRAYFGAAEV